MTRYGELPDGDLIAAAQESLERARVLSTTLIDAATRRLERAMALPLEPMPTEDDPTPVIAFTKTFGRSGGGYDYAAVRNRDGRWYTTGPRSPKDYSWPELLHWIIDREGEDGVDIKVATGWGDLR